MVPFFYFLELSMKIPYFREENWDPVKSSFTAFQFQSKTKDFSVMANQTQGLRLTFRVADMWTCLSMNMSCYEHVSLWKCLSMNMYLYEHVSLWTCISMNMYLYEHVSPRTCLFMNMSLYKHVSLSLWTCLSLNMSLYEHVFLWTCLSMNMSLYHVSIWTCLSMNGGSLESTSAVLLRSIVVIIKLIMIKIIKTHKIYKL